MDEQLENTQASNPDNDGPFPLNSSYPLDKSPGPLSQLKPSTGPGPFLLIAWGAISWQRTFWVFYPHFSPYQESKNPWADAQKVGD